jgi:hypothetical protein
VSSVIATDELDEAQRVYLKRYKEAREFGLTQLEARLFAESGTDVGLLRRLKADGCPPAVAAKILR